MMKNNPVAGVVVCFLYGVTAFFFCGYTLIGSLFVGGALESSGYNSYIPTIIGAVFTTLLILTLYVAGVLAYRRQGLGAWSPHLLMLSGLPVVSLFFGLLFFFAPIS